MLNILWITREFSWTIPLAELINSKVKLHIIIPDAKPNKQRENNGIAFYYLNLQTSDIFSNMKYNVAQKYMQIIDIIKPQVIHVHGTENNFAQIQNYITNIPIITSIQGILSGCIPFSTNFIREDEIVPYRTIKNFLGQGGYKLMERRCILGRKEFENNILKNGKYFFCRTHFDKAWVSFSNPNAIIYQGEEILRNAFYFHAGQWTIEQCNKHRIFMPSGFNPIKGLHIAIKVIALLKRYYPDVKLIVPGLPKHILDYGGLKSKIIGEEFVNYIKDLIYKNKLQGNIQLLPRLNDEQMALEMKSANVFLSPTSIDNSPNTVGEAMMVGVPVVVAPVGGIPSIFKDEVDCLFAPAGDEYIMAYQIKRIFEDDNLARKISKGGKQTALRRHDKTCAVNQYIDAYTNIILTKEL